MSRLFVLTPADSTKDDGAASESRYAVATSVSSLDGRRVSDDDWRQFTPRFDDNGQAYAALVEAVAQGLDDAMSALSRIANTAGTGIHALRLKASALVLRDLLGMGWRVRVNAQRIQVRPATSRWNPDKAAIRRQLEFGRNDQLREPATRRFIHGLERPGRSSNCRPVTDLIADGRRLADQLQAVVPLPDPERAARLADICQPYLQLVDRETRDAHTNIRLMDIWRYFRHTWATRYRSSPGRNVFYLVRDAAQPNHPIMAITALGNAVMQLTERDQRLGWTVAGLQEHLRRGTVTGPDLLQAFKERLKADYDEIYLEDLPVGPVMPADVSDDLLGRLEVIEQQAMEARATSLKADSEAAAAGRMRKGISQEDLVAAARSPLFRAKRARLVRSLLRTHRIIHAAASFEDLLSCEEGLWAVGQVLRQLKKRFSATGMMEITVCGGVPPYTHLLAGKLACLMMLSPRVVKDYAARYTGEYSIIASQMAGRPVSKEPSLVYLGTTSLYTQHSSQYNRVKLPPGTIPGQGAKLAFAELGVSEGYGSPNLSAETEAVLEELASTAREYRNVNFVFGEGQSPKLRQLREGFAALGLDRTDVLNHGSNRIIYGIRLAVNAERYLLGIDPVSAYIAPDVPDADTAISDYWRRRWLNVRLNHAPALAAVNASSPLRERVSRLLPETLSSTHSDIVGGGRAKGNAEMALQVVADDERMAFIRQLYRDESAYSDHVKIGRLREFNIKTKLDELVRKIVRAGGSVVITGNAGDGKTHTIRLLENDLKAANAEVIVDASEVSLDEVLTRWMTARAAGRPFCIAINEGPLIELVRAHATAHPWLAEIRDQLLNLVTYVDVDTDSDDRFVPEAGGTTVIDLSYRQTLAPDLVRRIIDKLTNDTWYSTCTTCPGLGACPVQYNRRMLRETAVQDRLITLLQRVAERGLRATFREALAFVSYLIFAGRPCSELVNEGAVDSNKFYSNAFEGEGAIFNALQRGLDPVQHTQPKTDEALWLGQYRPEDFRGHSHFPLAKRNLDDVGDAEGVPATEAFLALKRRWYFEHPDGSLGFLTEADRLFNELQDRNLSSQLRVGRVLALINKWWSPVDKDQEDHLRLWTRLSYSPRAQGKAMVSGRAVSNLRLGIFKPELTPALRQAFGMQAADHLLLGPPDNLTFASLRIDRTLMAALTSVGGMESSSAVERRLIQFNDALAQHAEEKSHVRTIELLDRESDQRVRLRVDLSQRRYDSAQ